MDTTSLAASIDQTMLKPTVGTAEAGEWMEANRNHGFASLCVSPFLVPLASSILTGTSTKVCSVVGFPLGYALSETKAEEAIHLLELGCSEIDMVVNIAALLDGDDAYVSGDIKAVVEAVRSRSEGLAIVKVILETGYLDEAQIAHGSKLAVEAGADYVKTSTGFGPRGASVRDVEIMRAAVGPEIGVKAAGGIRDYETALSMLEAGATRIGTSAGFEILTQAQSAGH